MGRKNSFTRRKSIASRLAAVTFIGMGILALFVYSISRSAILEESLAKTSNMVSYQGTIIGGWFDVAKISDGIIEISNVTQSNSQAAQESTVIATTLSEQATRLNGLLSIYKVNN